MPALTFSDRSLPQQAANATTLVVCLCANWCGTCRDYRPAFDALAERLPAGQTLVWLDIEDDADALADALDDFDDIEQFPTLWVEHEGVVRFHGPMLPHIRQLEDLLQRLREQRYHGQANGPDLRQRLSPPRQP